MQDAMSSDNNEWLSLSDLFFGIREANHDTVEAFVFHQGFL